MHPTSCRYGLLCRKLFVMAAATVFLLGGAQSAHPKQPAKAAASAAPQTQWEADGVSKLLRLPGFYGSFVAKYRSDGKYLWSFGMSSESAQLRGIGVDAQGQISLLGHFKGPIVFAESSFPAKNGLYMIRLSDEGRYLGTKELTPFEGSFSLHRVRPDNQGHLVVLGTLGAVPPSAGAQALRPRGGSDVFLGKYALDGTVRWVRQYGGPGPIWVAPADLDLDEQGNVVVFGAVNPPAVDLGKGVLTPEKSPEKTPDGATKKLIPEEKPFGLARVPAESDALSFLAKYDASGAPLWSRLLPIPGWSMHKTMAVDSLGNLWLAGRSFFDLTLDGTQVPRSGLQLGYLIKLDARGKQLWATRFGEREENAGIRLRRGSGGVVYFIKTHHGSRYMLSKLVP